MAKTRTAIPCLFKREKISAGSYPLLLSPSVISKTIHGWSADRRLIFAAPKSNASPSAVPKNSGAAGKSAKDMLCNDCNIAEVS